MRRSEYRPEIDGLRAISVVSVVAFHYGLSCPGGFCGVDVFYVISGYLITGLIRERLHKGQFSLQDFWARRIRRLLPALLVMVISVWAMAMVVLLPTDNKDLGKSLVAQSLLVSNVYFWRTNEYFGNASENKPLLHTWSLSVEEQFYLLLPALLLFTHGRSRLSTKRTIQAGLLASLAFSVWFTAWKPTAAFYLLPSRMWELLLGSLLSMREPELSPPKLRALGWLGMAFLAASFWLFGPATPFPGFAALLPCLGAIFILAGTIPGHSLHKFLTKPPMVVLGKISYSLYLWHWPLFVFLHYLTNGSPSLPQRVSGALLSVLLGYWSWRFVEQPWRQGKGKGLELKAGAVASLLLIFLGAISIWGNGFPGRFSPRVIELADAESDREMVADLNANQIIRDQVTHLGVNKQQADFVVWGDSHAMAISPGLDLAARRAGLSGRALTRSGTPPVLGYFDPSKKRPQAETLAFAEAARDYIRKRSVKEVILVGSWSYYSPKGLKEALVSTATELAKSGSRVSVLLEVPPQSADVPRSLALDERFSVAGHPWAATLVDYDRKNRDFLTEISHNPQIHLIDIRRALFDEKGNSIVLIDGRPVYSDSGHLSASGSKWLADFLGEQLGWAEGLSPR